MNLRIKYKQATHFKYGQTKRAYFENAEVERFNANSKVGFLQTLYLSCFTSFVKRKRYWKKYMIDQLTTFQFLSLPPGITVGATHDRSIDKC